MGRLSLLVAAATLAIVLLLLYEFLFIVIKAFIGWIRTKI